MPLSENERMGRIVGRSAIPGRTHAAFRRISLQTSTACKSGAFFVRQADNQQITAAARRAFFARPSTLPNFSFWEPGILGRCALWPKLTPLFLRFSPDSLISYFVIRD